MVVLGVVRACALLAVARETRAMSTTAAAHGRQLNADAATVRQTYQQAEAAFGSVTDKYRPMIEKLVSTNRMPNFLADFMGAINGFTADLGWVSKNPAIAGLLTQPEPGSPQEGL